LCGVSGKAGRASLPPDNDSPSHSAHSFDGLGRSLPDEFECKAPVGWLPVSAWRKSDHTPTFEPATRIDSDLPDSPANEPTSHSLPFFRPTGNSQCANSSARPFQPQFDFVGCHTRCVSILAISSWTRARRDSTNQNR